MATTRYISQAGAGTHDGLTLANAWSIAEHNAAAATITVGDTIIINGTVTSTINIVKSGTAGNVITYQYASGAKSSKASWTVVYNGDMTTGAFYATSKSYFMIDGGANGIIECTDNGDGGSGKSAYHQAGGVYIINCSQVEIKNLTIQNIYIHTYGRTNETGVGAYSTWGLFLDNPNTTSVHGCTFNNAYQGIYLRANSATTFSTNAIYDNTFSACSTDIIVGVATSGALFDGVDVYNNNVTMGLNWYESPNDNHVDGIHAWGVTGVASGISNLKVHHNYFHGDPGTHCTSPIYLEYGIYSPLVYNNVIIGSTNRPAEGYIHIKHQAAQGAITASVYNNTIVGLGSGATGGNGINVTAQSGTTLNAKNNIISTCFTGFYTGSAKAGTWNNDYNVLYNCGYAGWYATGSASLAAWQTASGGESHSSSSTPNLVGSYYIPTATSSAIAAGTDLSATFTTDISGATRSGWEIGAVDSATTSWSVGAGADVTTPTLTSSTINAAGTTITRTFSEIVAVGSGGSTGWVLTLSGGACTSTYSSGSGSSSLVYTLSRTPQLGETGTEAYTQPGNGIEDSSGNDLATLSGATITNNSTQQTITVTNAMTSQARRFAVLTVSSSF